MAMNIAHFEAEQIISRLSGSELTDWLPSQIIEQALGLPAGSVEDHDGKPPGEYTHQLKVQIAQRLIEALRPAVVWEIYSLRSPHRADELEVIHGECGDVPTTVGELFMCAPPDCDRQHSLADCPDN